MTAVDAAQDKIQKAEGKTEAGSDAVHGWVEGVAVVALGLEDNGIAEDTEEVAAAAQGKNEAVEDILEAADNAHHSLREVVEDRTW